MENKYKFKPYDRVLVKDSNNRWKIDFYSYFNNEYNAHHTMSYSLYQVPHNEILPYEGNEHLVGTTDEPEEEIELKEGEWVICSDNAKNYSSEWTTALVKFDHVCNSLFHAKDYGMWNYVIRLSDFDPNNTEETIKHILCVKNGKIIRYKE